MQSESVERKGESDDVVLTTAIAELLQLAARLLVLIAQVLVVIAMAIIDFALAVLYVVLRAIQWALPIILRALTVAVWLASLYFSFEAVHTLYAQFSDPLPTVAVSIAFALPVIAAPILLILQGQSPWGTFVFAALLGGIEWSIASQLLDRTETYPIVGVAPTIIAASGMLYLATRQKLKRRKENVTERNG